MLNLNTFIICENPRHPRHLCSFKTAPNGQIFIPILSLLSRARAFLSAPSGALPFPETARKHEIIKKKSRNAPTAQVNSAQWQRLGENDNQINCAM